MFDPRSQQNKENKTKAKVCNLRPMSLATHNRTVFFITAHACIEKK